MTNGPGSSFRNLQTTSKTLNERSFEVEVQKFHAKFATKVPTQRGKQHKNEVRKAHGKTTADLSFIKKITLEVVFKDLSLPRLLYKIGPYYTVINGVKRDPRK